MTKNNVECRYYNGCVVVIVLEALKGQSYNPLCDTSKFWSMDVGKLDAVQLYKRQRSNEAVDVLVLWVACQNNITLDKISPTASLSSST